MKNNRKRLNNKGFTLIELLAVVVILAVVMGIAMTSVLSSMNKSRGGSLTDSAMVIANAFTQKYTESLVDGTPSDIYSDVVNGYDFTKSATYTLADGLANTFKITTTDYALAGAATPITDKTAQSHSTVSFDASTGRFTVCLVAADAGKYFVAGYAADTDTTLSNIVVKQAVADPAAPAENLTIASGEMFACSDGIKSW